MDSRHPCQIYPWSKLPLASKRMCSSEKRLLEGKQDTFPEISFMDEMGSTNIFLKMELWNWSNRRNAWCLSTTTRWPFCLRTPTERLTRSTSKKNSKTMCNFFLYEHSGNYSNVKMSRMPSFFLHVFPLHQPYKPRSCTSWPPQVSNSCGQSL